MNNPFDVLNQRLSKIESLLCDIHANTTAEEDQFCEVKEAAKILRVSEQSILSYIKKGLIKAKKFGRPYLIPKSELFDDNGNVKSLKYRR